MEVAFLDADCAVTAPVAPAALDERTRPTVLVVAAESDFRAYVRECLRERKDLRFVEAATVTAATSHAAQYPLEFLVVDESERGVVATLANLRAIVVVDDVPHGEPASGARVRLLARPFTAERLLREVSQLLD